MRIRMIYQVPFEAAFGSYVVICGSACGSARYVDAHTPTVSCIFQADSVMLVFNAY